MATKYEDQWTRMATPHKYWQARMAEEVDTTFHKSDSQTNTLVYIHHNQSWCDSHTSPELDTGYSCATKSGCPSSHPCSRVWEPTGPGPYHQSCMSLWDSTPSHPSPVGHSLYLYTPVGLSLVGFLVDPQHTKWDHSPNGAPDDWPGKRAHAKTTKAKVSSGNSTPQVVRTVWNATRSTQQWHECP